MITPFLVSAFANWAAYQMRTPFARLAFSNAVEKVRQATLILIGNTGTPAFRHVEDMFKLMKAAKQLLIAQSPAVPSEIQLILNEDRDWQIVCDNLRHTKAGLTFMATDPALDRQLFEDALQVLKNWTYASRDHWAETVYATLTTVEDLLAYHSLHHPPEPQRGAYANNVHINALGITRTGDTPSPSYHGPSSGTSNQDRTPRTRESSPAAASDPISEFD